jgi:cupin 2 domain-containing protein
VTAPRFGRIGEGPAAAPGSESFAELVASGGTRVERIASHGVRDGCWYDQPHAEFVLLLAGAARLGFAEGAERALAPGDWVMLPAGCRHRVAWTAPDRETLWLAVHLPPG